MDGGPARCVAGQRGNLLVAKNAQAADHQANQDQQHRRPYNGELNSRRSSAIFYSDDAFYGWSFPCLG